MANDEKFKAAQKLIDEFAERLLALSEGKKIPTHWAIHLNKALKPKSGKAGRKVNYYQVAEVVKRLILAGDAVKRPRTQYHNPAQHKDLIAEETGTSRKTVERRMADIGQYLSEHARQVSGMRKALNGEERRKTDRTIYFNEQNFNEYIAPTIYAALDRAFETSKKDEGSFGSVPISPELHEAIVDGIAEALRVQLLAEIEAEDRAMLQQETRRSNCAFRRT